MSLSCVFVQAIESLDISDSLEVTAMTSKEKERVPFDTPMQASGTTLDAGHTSWLHGKPLTTTSDRHHMYAPVTL